MRRCTFKAGDYIKNPSYGLFGKVVYIPRPGVCGVQWQLAEAKGHTSVVNVTHHNLVKLNGLEHLVYLSKL